VTAGIEAARLGARNSLVQRYAAGFGGRLPESIRAAFVRETCIHRPRECVVLLAQWQRDAPGSAARTRILGEIQRQPQIAAVTPFGLVTQLARLYGNAAAPPDGSDAWQAAKRATDLFSHHYLHAAPFSRRALSELWRRCEADPEDRERCRGGRANAESVLGDLDVDLVQGGQ